MITSRWSIWLLLLPLALVGCGKGEPTLMPVEGRILFRGQPVDAGTVVFTPDPERGNNGPIAWAEILPDGRFRLKSDDRDGAVPGWHRITIAGSSHQVVVPAYYRDPERAHLFREIQPDASGPVELNLD